MGKIPFLSVVMIILVVLISGDTVAQQNQLEFSCEQEYLFDSNVYSAFRLLENNFTPLCSDLDGELNLNIEKRYLFRYKSIWMGYLEAEEQQLALNSDTVALLSKPIATDGPGLKKYNVNLKNMEQKVTGIYFGGNVWENSKRNLSLRLYGKLLNGLELNNREYLGEVIEDDGKLKMTGSRMVIFSEIGKNLTVQDITTYSTGYSTGIDLKWRVNNKAELLLNIDNLYSRIYWYNVYTEGGNYQTDNIIINEDGYFEYATTYQGAYDFKDYVTTLTPEYELSFENDVCQLGLLLRHKLYPYLTFDLLNKELFNKTIKIKGGLFNDFYSFELVYNGILINLKARELNPNTTGLGGEISINVSF